MWFVSIPWSLNKFSTALLSSLTIINPEIKITPEEHACRNRNERNFIKNRISTKYSLFKRVFFIIPCKIFHSENMKLSYSLDILEIKRNLLEWKFRSVTEIFVYFTRHYLYVTEKSTSININEVLSLVQINRTKNSTDRCEDFIIQRTCVYKIMNIFY